MHDFTCVLLADQSFDNICHILCTYISLYDCHESYKDYINARFLQCFSVIIKITLKELTGLTKEQALWD